MLLLASVLAVLATAQNQKNKRCLTDALGSSLVATFEACDINTQIQTCEKALDTCEKTLERNVVHKVEVTQTCPCNHSSNGGRPSAAIVFHENGDLGFPFVAANPDKAYAELIALTVKNFDIDEDHTVHFSYQDGEDEDVNFVVKDDESLRTALDISKAWDFRLKLHAMRMTKEPTTSPTLTPTNEPTPNPSPIPTPNPSPISTPNPSPMPTLNPTLHLVRQPWLFQKSGGYGFEDGRESGTVNFRDFSFKKRGDDKVGLRVLYNDVLHANGYCNWEVMFDDKSCPSGKISGTLYTSSRDDNYVPCTISGVCRGLAAGTHSMKIKIHSSSGYDCHTGYSPNGGVFLMELFELDATTAPMITYIDKVGPSDSRDSGYVSGRVLDFKKQADNSILRIFYSDNFYVRTNYWCKWEVYIDGKVCPSHRISAVLRTNDKYNDYTPKSVLGYCQNIKAGDHQMKIFLSRYSNTDCHTGYGWPTVDNFHMEVEEVREDDKRRTWIQKYSSQSADTGYISSRELTFNKLSENSSIRFMYNDNFRTSGKGVWCRWEIMIDNRKCPDANLAHAIYTVDTSYDNDHYPGTIVGYCDKLSKGKHTMRILLTNSGTADCYTGYDPHSAGNFVMEAEEIGRAG